ncbi:MAG: hypothetical protein V4581_17495 [Bacteroidota bacterium]
MKSPLVLFLILLRSSAFAQDAPYDAKKVYEGKEINLKADPKTDMRGILYKDNIYYIEDNLETITAYKADGSIIWQTNMQDVFNCPCVGKPGIRLMMIGDEIVNENTFDVNENELFVIYAKHDFAKINIYTGVGTYLGSD